MEHRVEAEKESFLSDSSSESEEEVPFHIPASEMVYRSHRNTAIAVVFGLAAFVAVVLAPTGGIFDPLSVAAFGYIYFVFCFQNTFVEWPAVPWHILALLAVSLCVVGTPTVLNAWGYWDNKVIKFGLWATDVGIIISGYRWMVRGPAYAKLAEGILYGKTFVITGCNTGIGYETAGTLARAGATVVFACRSEDRARAAMKKLVEESGEDIDEEQLLFVPLDTSSFTSVRRFATLLKEQDITPHTLIFNAGVMLSNRTLSTDGIEMTMATNHFGHFLLANLLLPSLLEQEKQGQRPRIVIVGSNMSYLHDCLDFSELDVVSKDDKDRSIYLEKPYELFRTYGQSKLANLHFTTELARRLKAKGSKIPVNQIHPGEVLTEVMRDMNPIVVKLNAIFRPIAHAFLKSPQQGSFCTLHVATDPKLSTSDAITGAHFVRCSPAPLSQAGQDQETARRLWKHSEAVTGFASMV